MLILISIFVTLPECNEDLMILVRYLEAADKGMPVEIYFFTADKEWVLYETLQVMILTILWLFFLNSIFGYFKVRQEPISVFCPVYDFYALIKYKI